LCVEEVSVGGGVADGDDHGGRVGWD
jgi:hypothetical protein